MFVCVNWVVAGVAHRGQDSILPEPRGRAAEGAACAGLALQTQLHLLRGAAQYLVGLCALACLNQHRAQLIPIAVYS